MGTVLRGRPPNPYKLKFGCIVVIRNYTKIVSGMNFYGAFEKSDFLKKSARMITTRRDRHNRYDIRVHYGVWLEEYMNAFNSHQNITM